MSKRPRPELLRGFRLLVDPHGPARQHRDDDLPSGPSITFEAELIKEIASSLLGTPSRSVDEEISTPRWRALMWGEHEPVHADEQDYPHRMVVNSYRQAPDIATQLDKLAPEPLLVIFAEIPQSDRLRLVDFLAGIAYGRRGQFARIGERAFAVAVPPGPDAIDMPSEGQLEFGVTDNRFESAG